MDNSTLAESLTIQEAWGRVFGSKGVLLVEEFPSGLEFGLNCMVYETGPQFKGVAMIPSGLHFVYYSHINFPRQGFFTKVSSSDPFRHRHWSRKSDELTQITAADILGQKVHQIIGGEYNAGFASYSDEHHTIWQNISQYITELVLQKANCEVEKTLQAGDDNDETEADRNLTRILTSDPKRPSFLSHDAGVDAIETARYCPIQSIEADIVQTTYKEPDFVKKLSSMELDKSWLVEALLQRYYPSHHWSSLLGELQISFIMFMLLYSYHSLNHWKLLIGYVSKAESFLQSNQDFTAAFLKVLFHQLKFIPDDFFENEISANSFILPSLTSLFSCLNFAGLSEDLQEHKKRFERYIFKRFNIRVVSTTISQYQSLDPMESLDTIHDLSSGNDADTNGVSDSYCVIDGNGFHENEEEAAEYAGREAIADSAKRGNIMMTDDAEFVSPNPVRLSIPMEQVLSPADKEELRFSWRYPIVFDAMKQSSGREDMIMTAMRLYDEVEYMMATNPSHITEKMKEAHAEAIKFIENEGPLLDM